MPRAIASKPTLADAQLFGQRLKLAVAVPHAIKAVVRVIGQEQLDNRLAGLHGSGRMGPNLHALVGGISTTRHQSALPLDFDHAHSASAARRQAVDMTKRRHLDAGSPQSGQKHLAFLRRNRPAVDFYSDHA